MRPCEPTDGHEQQVNTAAEFAVRVHPHARVGLSCGWRESGWVDGWGQPYHGLLKCPGSCNVLCQVEQLLFVTIELVWRDAVARSAQAPWHGTRGMHHSNQVSRGWPRAARESRCATYIVLYASLQLQEVNAIILCCIKCELQDPMGKKKGRRVARGARKGKQR